MCSLTTYLLEKERKIQAESVNDAQLCRYFKINIVHINRTTKESRNHGDEGKL